MLVLAQALVRALALALGVVVLVERRLRQPLLQLLQL